MIESTRKQIAITMVAPWLLSAVCQSQAGIPICDQLRKCATELAARMSHGSGWPARTISQYRRLGTAPLEEAPNAASMCRTNLRIIGGNAAKYQELGKLKALPDACRIPPGR